MGQFSYSFDYLLLQATLGFIVTFAFSIFFNAPKKSLIDCSLIGTLGWLVFIIFRNVFEDKVMATFLGAVIVGIIASNSSKRLHMPATVFIYTGIIPLVPGYGVYYTMQHFVTKHYTEAAQTGVDTILQAGSIAMGILVASIFSDSIQRVKEQRRRK